MPFTTSHPAIILLLKNSFPRYVSLTGLIAGAMSPDLLYFLEMTTVNRGLGHSWDGLFFICLPLGFLFCLLFHNLLKYELIHNLPSPIDRHFSGLALSEWKISNFKQVLILVVSVLIGGVSHFFWDSFTHLDGEMVGYLPFLKESIILFGKQVPLYHLLQHASTITGALAIAVYFSFKKNLPQQVDFDEKREPIGKIMFWVSGIVVGFLFGVLVLNLYKMFTPYRVPGDLVVFGLAGWSGFFYMVAGYSVFKKIRQRLNNSRTSEY